MAKTKTPKDDAPKKASKPKATVDADVLDMQNAGVSPERIVEICAHDKMTRRELALNAVLSRHGTVACKDLLALQHEKEGR